MDLTQIQNALPYLLIVIWSLFWKGWGLWRASKNDQRNWFVIILIVNSLGLLEIVYLLFFQKKGRYWEKVVAKIKRE